MSNGSPDPSIGVNLPPAFVMHKPVNMARVRSERFEKALKSYMLSKGNAWVDGSRQSWLADMMADAFHFCDGNSIDIDFVLKLARSHFEQEKIEDVKQGLIAMPKVGVSATSSTATH